MQWYLEEIERLEQQPLTPAGARPRVVFYGSSTYVPKQRACPPGRAAHGGDGPVKGIVGYSIR